MRQEKEMRKQLYVSLGLSVKAAEIYELLLANGEMAARQVELDTGFKKNTYVLIKELEKLHLLVKVERERRVYYQPAPPENLLALARQQLKSSQTRVGILLESLPVMKSMYLESVARPVVRYVEGEEGLRELYKVVYNQDIPASFGCLDLMQVERAVPKYMGSELIPERVRRNNMAYALLADNELGRVVAGKDRQENRQSILIDPKRYPIPAEISVYGDKVVLLSFKRVNVTGVLIENKEIAQSLTSVYRYLFETLAK